MKELKIVIAPDSFKESLTSLEVANAIEKGFKRVLPNAIYVKVPVADGGEGTVRAMVDACQGEVINLPVMGPLGDDVEAFYGLLFDGQTAVIEMAAASGLQLVPIEKKKSIIDQQLWHRGVDSGCLKQGCKENHPWPGRQCNKRWRCWYDDSAWRQVFGRRWSGDPGWRAGFVRDFANRYRANGCQD